MLFSCSKKNSQIVSVPSPEIKSTVGWPLPSKPWPVSIESWKLEKIISSHHQKLNQQWSESNLGDLRHRLILRTGSNITRVIAITNFWGQSSSDIILWYHAKSFIFVQNIWVDIFNRLRLYWQSYTDGVPIFYFFQLFLVSWRSTLWTASRQKSSNICFFNWESVAMMQKCKFWQNLTWNGEKKPEPFITVPKVL